jgi:hypothetical protein
MTKSLSIACTLFTIAILTISSHAYAACEVVDGGNKKPFDGNLSGLTVEKKSLSLLNKEYPSLNVVEKTFKGEVQTCSSCSEKYVTCN